MGSEAGGMPKPRWTLRGHRGPVDSCAISADGARVASGGRDQAVRVWDARSGELMWTIGGSAPVRATGFSQDGRFLAAVSDEFVTLWDLQESFPWDPDGRQQLACLGWLGSLGDIERDEAWIQACRVNLAEERLRVWFALPGDEIVWGDYELEDGCLIEPGDSIPNAVQLAFRPDGAAAVVVRPELEISVDPVAEEYRALMSGIIPLNAHDRSRGLLAVGNTHAICGQGSSAYVSSTAGVQLDRMSIDLDGALVACSVASDRPLGVTACIGAEAEPVCVWDLERREVVRRLAVSDVTDCMLSADGAVLVTSSRAHGDGEPGIDGVVQVWNL